ncbi:hypothetical protein E3P99_01042 [Wallemia hederae]|uniref:RlpA-like protein double-psi beta-barrel domain-containing protein n=1 Tax=Wallemia hederae TaxID=1540922 RepID=A0A4T0FX93_9BASI|nr:hypothetical protein E3P99_01042 [Wallemia hederae]
MNFSQILFTIFAIVAAVAIAAPVPKSDDQAQDMGKRGLISGIGSFFAVGLGACGAMSQPSDMVIALPNAQWSGGNNCWKHYTVTNTKTGQVMDATAVDQCPTCQDNQIDLSEGLFSALTGGNMDQGLCELTWAEA